MVIKRSVFLQELLDPDLLKKRLRFCAMYDAIVAPEFRSFEFHPKWRPREQMGAFKNGSGDFFFAWFPANNKGAVIRGFAHERKPQDPAVVFDGLPPQFAYVRKEPAFAQDELTFALWHTRGASWRASDALRPVHDGAIELLGCLDRNFEKWRRRYYGSKRSKAIEVLWWEREPITREAIHALNPDADLDVVREEAKLLAWPLALDDTKAKTKTKPKTKGKAKAKAKPQPDFGEAEFVVRCEPTRVRMMIHGTKVVAEAKVDVYGELFDLVKARLDAAKRKGA
jgi:hypothetical protein